MASNEQFIILNLLHFPLIFLIIIASSIINGVSAADELSTDYYSTTCPNVLSIVEKGVEAAIQNETRMGASLLRLHFHDCFVNGCDASVLLDDNATFIGEKTAQPNNNSIRGFDVVDEIKSHLEQACPGVVSCADLLAIAARDSVVRLGGPTWEVKLGRRDSLTANKTAADIFIPSPNFNLSALNSSFAAQGLSFTDMVALSGAHTIGFARCVSFRSRIYNDTDIDVSFAEWLRGICPTAGNDNVLQGLDVQTDLEFDNKYYENLMVLKGLLHSDQELYNGNDEADALVKWYVRSEVKWYEDFIVGIVKMGDIKPLTGSEGEVRVNCRRVNGDDDDDEHEIRGTTVSDNLSFLDHEGDEGEGMFDV